MVKSDDQLSHSSHSPCHGDIAGIGVRELSDSPEDTTVQEALCASLETVAEWIFRSISGQRKLGIPLVYVVDTGLISSHERPGRAHFAEFAWRSVSSYHFQRRSSV